MRLLRLRTILLATDLTEVSDAALVTAARLVSAAGATLHVVHVTAESRNIVAAKGRRTEFESEIRQSLGRAGVDLDWEQLHLVGGETAAAIADVADRVNADVIILGRRGKGPLPSTRPLGGTAYGVIDRTGTPCLCVMRPLDLPATRVLVGVDYSIAARGALIVGLSWASGLRSRGDEGETTTLIALNVDTGAAASDAYARAPRAVNHELNLIRRHATEWGGVEARGETITDRNPADAIARFTREEKCQLIVLGTRSASVSDGQVLGSVSANVLAQIESPVLLVPPAVWGKYAKEIDYF